MNRVLLLAIPTVAIALAAMAFVERTMVYKLTQTEMDLNTIAVTLKMYKLDHGAYPMTQFGLKVLTEGKNPLLPKIPTDEWGRDFYYHRYNVDGREYFEVWTLGQDGIPGGTEKNEDIRVSSLKFEPQRGA